MVIREYNGPGDRNAIRRICCDTAFMGQPVENFFGDREIIADLLTLYHTDHEPESVFIAEHENMPVGYIMGCTDIRRARRIFLGRILPGVAIKSLLRGTFLSRKSLMFLYRCAVSFFRKELFIPDFSGEYPAVLHINIESRFRNMGTGEKLVMKFLDYLKEKHVRGVHLTTISADAARFFERNGFTLLQKKKISYFSHLNRKTLFRFTLGKNLAVAEVEKNG